MRSITPSNGSSNAKECLTRFRGADSAFAGGLLAFQGADAQVDKALKWRYVVATKPFILAVWRLSSPSKAK
ncbi:amino acid permease domain protein [Bifidobacterium longum]|nr:amino acid permease domain protein [Bifidobacterium longum]